MLTLDDEDYELLGFNAERAYEEYTLAAVSKRTQRDEVWEKFKASPEYKAWRKDYERKRDQRPERKLKRAIYNREVVRHTKAKVEADKRYKKSEKGKAVKARSWKKYYEKNKAKIMARVAAHRKGKAT